MQDNGQPLIWSFTIDDRNEIEKIKANPLEHYYSANCHKGVWDEGIGKVDNFYKAVKEKRQNCFFYSHQSNMLFKAADELQKRDAEYKKMKSSNLYTRIGLWIAIGALSLNALIGVLKLATNA
ncbi:MAG: rRNA processing protein Gar1 [Colwellia sp.]|jgi:hypothetical protein